MHSQSNPQLPLTMPLVLAALAGIYTIQSIIGMLTFQGIPAILRAEGISTTQIGLLYLIMLPWALKFLWAPAIERFRQRDHGLKRHCILISGGQWLMACSLLTLVFFPPTNHLGQLFIGLTVIALISTLVDITADGFAVDQLSRRHYSYGNVMQVGGSYLGAILGGGLFIYITDQFNWQIGLTVLAAGIILMSLPALSLINRQKARTVPKSNTPPSLITAWRKPTIRYGLLLVVMTQFGTRMVLVMMMPFMIDRGIDLSSLGLITAGGGAPASIIGVLVSGWVISKIGAVNTLLVTLAVEGASFIAFTTIAATDTGSTALLTGLFIVLSMLTAAKFVALYTLMMTWSAGEQSAVEFTLFQSADMAVAIISALLGGVIISQLGYWAHFLLALVFTLVSVYLFYRYRRQHSRLTSSAEEQSNLTRQLIHDEHL